jgi:hypothetical protein
MYKHLDIPSGTHPLVSQIVRETIDPRLSDVHAMLRLPLPEDGLRAACNFAIADSLFGVLEGVSAVLFPRWGAAVATFLDCVRHHYQPEIERPKVQYPAVSAVDLPVLLSARYRNPMQHALGLALRAPDSQGGRWPDRHGDTLFVFRDKEGLSEAQVESMEREQWPSFLDRPTLGRESGQLILSVEAFYVGTRRVVANVLQQKHEMDYAGGNLEHLFGEITQSPPARTDQLSGLPISPAMVNSGATLTAQTSVPRSDELWK